jgi:hypothetical protein
MRQMKDSTNPAAIPVSTALVAGYVPPSRFAWSAAAWGRFTSSIHVSITPSAAKYGPGIHVLDVEKGDATAAQVPGWVLASRGNGQEPTVYTALANWATVIQACINAGVTVPQFWIAEWDGGQTLPSITVHGITYTAVAKQYADPAHGSGGDWDTSIVADHWPGVDEENDMLPTDLLNYPIAVPILDANGNYVGDQKDSNGNVITAPFSDFLRFSDIAGWFNVSQLKAMQATLVGQGAAITALASAQGSPVTADQVKQMIDDAVAQHVQITGTVQVTGVAGTTQPAATS